MSRYAKGSTITTLRANICRRLVRGDVVYEASVRGAYAKRTFVGRFSYLEYAEAACAHFIATGERGVREKRQRKVYAPRAPKPSSKPAPRPASARGGAERWAAVYRERLAT